MSDLSTPSLVAIFRLSQTLTGHTDAVLSIAFSPAGQTLATGSFDHTVRLWEAATGRQLGRLTGHTKSVTSVAFNTAGTLLASASVDRTIRVWALG